ncbi:MAG: hypothetical protein ABEJ08_00585 [Halobacteriaceae archaeon]
MGRSGPSGATQGQRNRRAYQLAGWGGAVVSLVLAAWMTVKTVVGGVPYLLAAAVAAPRSREWLEDRTGVNIRGLSVALLFGFLFGIGLMVTFGIVATG